MGRIQLHIPNNNLKLYLFYSFWSSKLKIGIATEFLLQFNRLKQFRRISFSWKYKLKPTKFDYKNGLKNNIGWIAQDVQEVIPEAVSIGDEKTGMLALKSDFIVPYLVKAIQELKNELETLKNK